MKEAWDTKREMLEKGGDFAIEQLSEALSATASCHKLSDELAQNSLKSCVKQVTV